MVSGLAKQMGPHLHEGKGLNINNGVKIDFYSCLKGQSCYRILRHRFIILNQLYNVIYT